MHSRVKRLVPSICIFICIYIYIYMCICDQKKTSVLYFAGRNRPFRLRHERMQLSIINFYVVKLELLLHYDQWRIS